jgi:cytochrome c oxidase assembly protein subunit 15
MDTDSGTRRGVAETLALGFGTSVAMWFLAYLCRMPPAVAPPWLLAVGLLACLVVGGFLAGRFSARGWRAGLTAGLLCSGINLLVLGSLLGGSRPNQVVPSAAWWLPGSLLLGAALATLGAALGARTRTENVRREGWTGVFASVAAAATLLQLLVGGIVTGNAAGLAVVDWPNSFGYNMFLYPLSRMTGGIYYEHAHRLFGTLVGLTTLVLAIHLLNVERRAWVRRLALLAVLVVVVQGILGGLRVTGAFTLSTSPAAMSPSVTLAIVHGVLGPAFFGLMVALAVFVSPTWTGDLVPESSRYARADRTLGVLLVSVVLVQLVLGAIQRHLGRGLLVHITFAVVVLALAFFLGSRLWGLYPRQPLMQRLGQALIIGGGVQIVLGFAAFFAVETRVEGAPRAAWEVLLTTAHQAWGALLLGCAVMTATLTHRLLTPDEPERAETA